eukprot:2265774-Rhodomonas_salina.1
MLGTKSPKLPRKNFRKGLWKQSARTRTAASGSWYTVMCIPLSTGSVQCHSTERDHDSVQNGSRKAWRYSAGRISCVFR